LSIRRVAWFARRYSRPPTDLRSALRAVFDAAPYPIPAGAECIAGLSILGKFSNPLDR
jgi:hypothetical protein